MPFILAAFTLSACVDHLSEQSVNQNQPSRIVSPKNLPAEYGLADSTIRGWEKAGLFPARKKFGPRVCGWFRTDFEAALRKRAEVETTTQN
jgi:predicted DNA-binding transcriptional regulator AlpA